MLSQSVYAEGVGEVLLESETAEETTAATTAPAEAVLETETEVKISYVPMDIEEKFNYDYNLYEEVMNNRFVFYSTVSNGGITDKSVSMELPKNISCKMEKDGEEVPFANRMEIDEIGSYVLNLLVDSKDVYGAEENTVYFGLFRFKIVEPKPEETTTEEVIVPDVPDESEPAVSEDKDGEFELVEVEETEATTTELVPLITTEEESSVSSATESSVTESTADTTTATGTSAAQTTTQPPETAENPDKPKGSTELIAETYNTLTGFEVRTRNGAVFTSNIPCGMTTTESVTLNFSGEIMTKVYKNEEEIDSSVSYNEIGKYEVYIYDGSSEPLPLYTFEIIPTLTNSMESYTAPNGCIISFAGLEGKQIAAAVQTVKTDKDGKYNFIVTKGDYTTTVEVTRDTTPPEISLYGVNENNVAENGLVEIEIVTNDMKTFTVTKDGQPFTARSLSFKDSGKYKVEIFDEAGNSVTAEFEIPYQINAMGVIIIIVLIGLVGGLIGYAVYSRRHFNIK